MDPLDYILLFDEYGEPYLEHALFKRRERANHKYIEKIPNALGDGKDLYLYTQAEVDAWYKKGKRTLGNRIKDALGYDERIARDEARERYATAAKAEQDATGHYFRSWQDYRGARKDYDAAQQAYAQTLYGKLDRLKISTKAALSSLTYDRKKVEKIIASYENDRVAMTYDTAKNSRKKELAKLQDEYDVLSKEAAELNQQIGLAKQAGHTKEARDYERQIRMLDRRRATIAQNLYRGATIRK